MDDSIEYSDIDCPKCGGATYYQECTAVGCDGGYYDGHEYDDPMWYLPGEMVRCEECHGRGQHIWCPSCGWDLLDKQYLNGRPENEDGNDA